MNGYRMRPVNEIETDLVAAAYSIALWITETRRSEFANVTQLSERSEGLQAVLREYRVAMKAAEGSQ